MGISRRHFLQAGALGTGLAAPWAARAQSGSGPAGPEMARLITGFPAGGTPDVVCRRVAEKLYPGYARASVVENRTGAAGQIAVSAVKTAAPDGSSILLTPMSILGIYPHTYKKLPYDPVHDLSPVSMGVRYDYAFAVGPAVPESVRSLPEFLAWARANPARAMFGSPAMGSALHFTGVLLGRAGGVELTHVGFRGTQPAIMDMAGGQLPAVCGVLGDLMKFAAAGKCRILGTSGSRRSRFTPDIPTFVEQGYKDLAFGEWFGFYLPAKAAPELVQRLNKALRQALAAPDVVEGLAGFGLEPAPSSPAELAAALKADTERWGPLVQLIGFSADA